MSAVSKKKNSNWPSEATVKSAMKTLAHRPSVSMLSPTATPAQKFKFELCESLLAYMQEHKLTQRELAKAIGIDEARISEILHYKIDRFSIDRLVEYVMAIRKNVQFKMASGF